jgi:hypothetical protein
LATVKSDTQKIAAVTSPTKPMTIPAMAMPSPLSRPPDRLTSPRALKPKNIPSNDPRPPNQTMDKTSEAMAEPLVPCCWTGAGAEYCEALRQGAGPPGPGDGTTRGVPAPGFCSGGYHRRSDACHQPGPCDVRLICETSGINAGLRSDVTARAMLNPKAPPRGNREISSCLLDRRTGARQSNAECSNQKSIN